MTDSRGPAAPAPLDSAASLAVPIVRRSIKQAGWGEIVETGERLYRAVMTLPPGTLGSELACATQDFYDAIGRAARFRKSTGSVALALGGSP